MTTSIQSISLSENQIKLLLFWLIILAGVFLRFNGLEKDSYCLDEGASIFIVDRPLAEIFLVEEEPNPPLFNFILHFWINLFGKAEGLARLLPAIFSALALFFVYKLAIKIMDDKAGLLATLIFALSPHQIYFAQELRAYSLLVLLSIASTSFFIGLIQSRSLNKNIFYIITTVLLLLTHIYGWFVFLCQILWIIFFNRKIIKNWIISFSIISLLFSPYLYNFIPTLWQVSGQFWLNRPGFVHFFGSAAALSGSLPLFILYTIIILGALSIILKKRFIKKQERWKISFLLFWILITYIFPFLLSQIITPFFMERYLIVSVFPAVLLIAYLITNLPNQIIRKTIIALIVVLSLTEIYIDRIHATREPWRELVSDLKEEAAADDVFVVAAGFCIENILNFYTDSLSQKRIGVLKEDLQKPGWKESIKNKVEPGQKNIWLILSHFDSNEEKLSKWFCSNYEITREYTYSHRDVFGRWVTQIKMIKYRKI